MSSNAKEVIVFSLLAFVDTLGDDLQEIDLEVQSLLQEINEIDSLPGFDPIKVFWFMSLLEDSSMIVVTVTIVL